MATGPAAVVFAALIAGRLRGPVLWARLAHARAALNPEGLSRFFDPSRLVIAGADRPVDILWTAEEALRSGAAPFVVAEVAAPPALTPLRRLQLAAEAGGEAARRFSAAPLAPVGAGPAPSDKFRALDRPGTVQSNDDRGGGDGGDGDGGDGAARRSAEASRKARPGAISNGAPPLCLIISPEAGTAGAIESRWRCDPLPGARADAPAAAPRWRFERLYGKSGPPFTWETGADNLSSLAA